VCLGPLAGLGAVLGRGHPACLPAVVDNGSGR
jgi:hypothetical protein